MEFTNLFAARTQMAFTLGWHIVVACLGVGLPVLMLFAEWRCAKTGDRLWQIIAMRWSKAFAVLFAAGAVFELGLLWPAFMQTFGPVIGLAFTMEGFFFFFEAIFVGIYIYTWDKFPARTHFLCGFPIAISGLMSAWSVVTANAWMNTPRGFRLVDQTVVEVDPVAAMFNPATWAQTIHMIIAAYMVTGFLVASFYALERLRGANTLYNRRAMTLGLVLGVCFAPVQVFVGDWAAKMVAETQPIKLAAMEGQFETQRGAPIRIGGWPDVENRKTPYAIEIPYLLSMMAYGDPDAEVKGLEEFPETEWPPIPVVHIAFQLMVGIGTGLIGLAVWTAWSCCRHRKLPGSKLYLYAVVSSGPLSVLALEAGWVVTEVGRQPWIVNGYMRTEDAVSQAPGMAWLFLITLGIYCMLTVGVFSVLRILARQPLPEGFDHGA